MNKKKVTVYFLVAVVIQLFGCASWRHNKEKAELYLRMGNALLEEGNYANSLAALLKADELDPQNPVILSSLGQVYFMREKYDLAEKSFKKAVSLQPQYTDAHNNLARVLIEQNKFNEAEKELKTVLSDLTYPAADRAYINLGLLKYNKKEFSLAEDSFKKALKAKPDDCIASSYYGQSIFEQKEYPRAAEALDRAIGFCQKLMYDSPHYFSALAHYRMGDKTKSVARFEELMKYYPDGKYRDKAKGMLELIRKGQ